MTAKEHIERIVSQKITKFISFDTERNLLQAYNLDEEFSKGYHGRELFELLQNVDDAYEELCQNNTLMRGRAVKTLIEYKNNILRVCNTGTSFRKDTIERLCQGAVSAKDEKYIGNKGIGFRAILNWSKKIRIYSGDYSIEFSEDYAKTQFDRIKDNEIVKTQIEEMNDLSVPILYAPKWIEPKKSDYNTVIEIELSENAADENDRCNINNQINEFDSKILLFLPNVTEIVFSLQETEYSFKKKTEKITNIISIQRIENTKISEEKFYCFVAPDKKIANTHTGKDSVIKMSVAIPFEGNYEINSKLYTFFPIGTTKSPFNAILHATFLLADNRESIRNESINIVIFKELLKFYVDTVTENFCKPEFENRCLELLCPKNFSSSFNFESPFNSDEILKYYLDLCKGKARFFTVNEKFVSNSDNPKIIKDAPKFFKGEIFSDLLIPIKESLDCFVREITDDISFSDSELCERINKLSKNLSIKQRVEVFIWWITNKNSSYFLPGLLQDNTKENKWLSFGSTCFLSGEISNIPEWADFRFLDNRYEKEIKEHYHSFSFNLPQYNKFINFENFTIESIISPLNEKVNDDFDRSVDFVQFLYINFNALKNIESLKEISFNFPNANGEVSDSRDLYFGKEYGNDFSEKILELAGYTKVCSIKTLGLENVSENDIKEFLAYFGCVEYPKIEEYIEVYSIFSWNAYHTQRVYKEKGDKLYRNYVLKKENHYEINGIKTHAIRNLKNIILSLNNSQLINWIFTDKKLKSEILKDYSEALLMYRSEQWQPREKSYNYSDCKISVPCYLNYVFSTTKWLEIDGEKYAPSECLFSTDSRIAKYYKQCISSNWIKQNCGNFSPKEFKELLLKLGMKSKITELDSENFYSILLELQKDDNSFEISKQIYSNIISDEIKNFEYSETKSIFQREGKVWTKNKKGYQLVSDVFFSGSAVVNVHDKCLIDLPLRTGSKEVMKNVFFVEPYEESYTIEQTSIHKSLLDAEFQKRFYEYLPYIFCYRIETADSTEQKKFKNLKIKIVDAIRIKDDEGVEYVSASYTLLRDSANQNQWYIFTKDENPNWNELSELLKQVFEVLINTANINKLDRFCELFIADKSRRDFLIEKDFGRISILNESKKFLYGSESERGTIENYLKQHHKLSTEAINILNELDFSNLSNCTQQQKLYSFLQLINLDVGDLQKILERNDISIKEYNLKRLEKSFSNNIEEFKQTLYESLKEKTLNEKKLFLQKLDEYRNYQNSNNFEGINSIHFDIAKIYNKALGCFLNDKKKAFSGNLMNINKFYSKNVEKLKKTHGESSIESFLSAIPQETESLLYFEYADIENEFKIWEKDLIEQNTKSVMNKFEAANVHFDEVKPIKNASNQSEKTKNGKVSVPRVKNESDKEKQEQGDTAEKDIYDAIIDCGSERHKTLEEKLGVILSEYIIGQISKGLGRKLNQHGEDGLGYDIELLHKNAEKGNLYIEVKSSKASVCQFDVSKNELDFAKEHSDNYRLIFVGNMDKKEHSIQILPKQFWKMDEEYKIIPKDYIIQCIKK